MQVIAAVPSGPDYNAMTDEELVLLWQDEESERAAELLDHRWRNRLGAYFGRFVPRDIAEDLAQETLFRVFCKGAFREGNSYAAWTMTIAGRVLIDYYRRTGRLSEIALETDDDSGPSLVETIASESLGPDGELAAARFRIAFVECVSALPARQRFVLVQRALGVPNQEIAKSLGCTNGPTTVTYHRAIDALRQGLAERGYEAWQLTGPNSAHSVVMTFADEKIVCHGRAPHGGEK